MQEEHILRSQYQMLVFTCLMFWFYLSPHTTTVSAVIIKSTLLLATDQKYMLLWQRCFHTGSVSGVEAAELLPWRQCWWMQEGLMCMF